MKLELNIADLAGPGRPALPLEVEYVRDVTEADLELLAAVPAQSKAPGIKRVTERHHGLARLIASGMKPGEAALLYGYDPSRVSILLSDPTFMELVELRRQEADREVVSLLQLMTGISRDALLELMARLEETPERFSIKDLKDIASDFVDRASMGEVDTTKLPTVIELVAPAPATPPGQTGDDESGEADL